MLDKQITCKNCEKKFESNFQFCPYCGQKANDELTLGVLFYNTISNYFSFDARFFKSFIPLMVKPGYLAKRFIEGKRLLYIHPAQVYLFISVVFFFLFSFISRDQVESMDKNFKETMHKADVIDSLDVKDSIDSLETKEIAESNKLKNVVTGVVEKEGIGASDTLVNSITGKKVEPKTVLGFNKRIVDSLTNIGAEEDRILEAMGMSEDPSAFQHKLYSQLLKLYRQRNGGALVQAFYDSIPLAMFILLPIFAVILKLLFYKRGSFSHHLVFTFYFFAFLFMVFSLLIIAEFLVEVPGFIVTLLMLSTFFYLFLAVKRFYGQGWGISFFKANIVAFTFLLFVLPLAAIIVGIGAFMFY
ncbi:DUF3667 domain-containing protein [Snuella sedimenti]|uniref:DUF3667 domain-containing protein n=1 Tax=Snuella sedimenti TaxID=2798802 RepID=A0A8J7IX56_9FLAO|nr:DUF3667 domain-containing protein [Snuella sedimenti]MBJ6368815.1 DUF3667 domain-containing protein [Snuella sedimenti]